MKIYELCCHGCGKLHAIRATFLSVPMSIIANDGENYGCRACEECMQEKGRIKRAYDALMAGTFEEFKKENWK